MWLQCRIGLNTSFRIDSLNLIHNYSNLKFIMYIVIISYNNSSNDNIRHLIIIRLHTPDSALVFTL